MFVRGRRLVCTGGLTSALWRAVEGARRRRASGVHQRGVRPYGSHFVHQSGPPWNPFTKSPHIFPLSVVRTVVIDKADSPCTTMRSSVEQTGKTRGIGTMSPNTTPHQSLPRL